MLKIGSHVKMSGKDMLLGSAKEAKLTVRMYLWHTQEHHRTQEEKT